jgi:alkylation response protein AidB-like acyl-CoA dehydrogenase
MRRREMSEPDEHRAFRAEVRAFIANNRPPTPALHASEVFAGAVQRGVQLHGGFGFTWEADLHFFFKRMLATRASFGDAAHHKRKLAASLFGQLPDEP